MGTDARRRSDEARAPRGRVASIAALTLLAACRFEWGRFHFAGDDAAAGNTDAAASDTDAAAGDADGGGGCGPCTSGACIDGVCRRAVQIAAGLFATCAALDDGTVRCWGQSGLGALGNGTLGISARPVQVLTSAGAPLTDVRLLAGAHGTMCAVRTDNTLWCWGRNVEGEHGRGDADRDGGAPHPYATQSMTATPFDAVMITGSTEAGTFCAVLGATERRLVCWGFNLRHEPQPSYTPAPTPVMTADGTPLVGVVDIAIGLESWCAVLQDGRVLCWGSRERGQLGLPAVAGSDWVERPRDAVVNLRGMTAVTAGSEWACASNGRLLSCWGSNAHGTLGVDPATLTETHVPQPILGHAAVIAIGAHHGCSGRADLLYCWGENDQAQLGLGTIGGRTPGQSYVVMPGPTRQSAETTQLALGLRHSCAISAGNVLCWGDNSVGQAGRDPPGSDPVPLPSPLRW